MFDVPLGWTFLVARGRHHGYRTVLAPDFLTERDRHGLLTDSISGENLGNGRRRVVTLEDEAIGRLTVVCVTEQLSRADLGGGGDGLATDEHGRPLEALYGVVSRDRLSGQLDDGDLSTARAQSLESYRRFLAQEDTFGVDSSRSFALRGVARVDAPPPPTRPPVPARPSAPSRAGAPRSGGMPGLGAGLAFAVAVAAAVLVVIAWPRGGPAVEVEAKAAISAPKGKVDCARPVTLNLRGTITTSGPATVTYRWEPAVSKGARGTLKFATKGSMKVKAQAVATTGDGKAILGGEYALVVDTPAIRRAAASYRDLPCATASTPVSPPAQPSLG